MGEGFERKKYYQDVTRSRSGEPMTESEREAFEGRAQEVIVNAEAVRSNGQFIGSGEIADVFAGLESSGDEELCLKFIARSSKKSIYTNNLEREMELQVSAFDILEEERKKGDKMARTPRPIAYLKTDGGAEYMAMERVRGKTLYRILLERVAQQLPEEFLLPGMRPEDVSRASDEDMEQIVIWNYLKGREKTSRELYAALLERVERAPFLSADIFEKVRNAISALNKKGFFHRDLHEKNIMFSEDLSEAYLIDFGSSSSGEHNSPADAYEIEKWGEKIKFLDDKYIVHVLRRMTVPREKA